MLTLADERPVFTFHVGRYDIDSTNIDMYRDGYDDYDGGEFSYIRADLEVTTDQRVLEKVAKLFPSLADFNTCKKEFEDLADWFKTGYKIESLSKNSTCFGEDERIIYGAVEKVVPLIQKYEKIQGLEFIIDGSLW
jgi:5-bromo-4-chloroindolyl phosphate hydrolysis protein